MYGYNEREANDPISDVISNTQESWQRKERLRFIDAKLFWTGTIRRDDICRVFELHTTNASKDIKLYIELAENNLSYDRKAKVYRTTPEFEPISRQHKTSDLLAYTTLGIPWSGYIPSYLNVVELPIRQPSSLITRNVLHSIHEQSGIEITYRSMNNPDGLRRWIFPKVVIFDGLRWHTRAFDEKSGQFQDFVMSRIATAGKHKPSEDIPSDPDWEKNVDIRIAPHKKLTSAQAKMIEYDYAMTDGELVISTRHALAAYIIRHLNLDTELTPPRQQIQCINLKEVTSISK